MNADLKTRNRKQLIWPLAGIAIGVLAAINPFYAPHITFAVGITVWCIDMLLVLILSAHPVGARIGAFLGGLFLAVPCFVWESPLSRGVLMCFMALPWVAGTALVLAPPMAGFRARLAYLCSWDSAYPVNQRTHSFDAIAFRNLIVATAVFAAAIAALERSPDFDFWRLPVRWLAGGIMVFAFAEIVTASHNFFTALMGVTAPSLFRSPHLSASVGEFWTKRWNIGASEIFRRFCFAPLARHGVGFALFATFIVSAIAHVLLFYMALGNWSISLLCGAFFLVQPLLITTERWMNVRRWRPAAARAWTLTVLTITSPLFVEPLLQVTGTPDSIFLPTVITLGFVIFLSGVISLTSFVSATETVALKRPD